jgi:hypothetical protein
VTCRPRGWWGGREAAPYLTGHAFALEKWAVGRVVADDIEAARALPTGRVPVNHPEGAQHDGPTRSAGGRAHRFRQELSLAQMQQALADDERPGRIPDWLM